MSVDSSSVDVRLHKYAFEGKKSKLKSLLKKEQNINLEALDFGGHTALYYACLNGHKGCVKLLLESHANPNERCKNGETAVHAATKSGNTKVLALLIQFGGDLRLHDNEGRAPRAWAMYQTNPNLRRKMLSFIEEARYKAMLQSSKQNGVQTYQPSNSQFNIKAPDGNRCSAGFGTLYKSSTDIGVPILVPVINENELVHDSTGLTINNGAFMVYESMKWKEKHFVTVKRLHGNTVEGGCVDLLIEELQILSRINYSKIIQLMGICQTQNIESLILMFERIEKGSLFYIMHEEKSIKAPKLKSIVEIMLTICNALIYLHEQNIIHCYVNSHSVLIVSPHIVKLGNLEFAIEKASDPSKQKRSRVVDSKYTNCAYNWLAPEMMDENDIPSEMSDMYSFCSLFWELFNVAVPWADMEWKQIRDELLINNNSLQINFDLIPLPFSRIIKDGLSINSINRMSFEDVKGNLESVRSMIYAAKKSASMKKSMNKKAAAAAAAELHQIKSTTGESNYGEVPIASGGVPVAKPARSRSEAYYPAEQNLRKANTADDVKSLDHDDNSEPANSMATLNSQEFDELSRMTGNSFIYCDAYKAEIHLRKGSLPLSAIKRSDHSKTQRQQIPTSTSNNSGLYSTTHDGVEKQRFTRTSPNIEHKIESSRRRSKRIPRSEDSTRRTFSGGAHPLVNDSLIKTRAGSLSQPPPPPPPPPPPAPSSATSSVKYRSASTSAFQHRGNNEDQQLPRDSMASPVQQTMAYSRHHNTIPSLPVPPSFVVEAACSSPTTKNSQNRQRKPRSASSTAASTNNDAVYSVSRASPTLKQTSPNSACGSILERKKSLCQRFSQFETGERPINSARFSSPAPRASHVDTNNNNNNNLFQRSDSSTPPKTGDNEGNRSESASARRSKLIETLYYTNSNIMLNSHNKKRLFEALQHQQMIRDKAADRQQPTGAASEDHHIERDNPFRAQLVPNVSGSGSQLSPTEQQFHHGHSSRNTGGAEPIKSSLLSSIKASMSKGSMNGIDTQTFYTMAKRIVANDETDQESSAHLPPPPSDFELNTKLSGYNATNNYKEIKSMFDSKASSSTPDPNNTDFVRKPAVAMTNKFSKSYTNLRQAQQDQLVSSPQSECGNYAAGPRRKLVMKASSLHNDAESQSQSTQRHKSHSVDAAGHRSGHRLAEMSPSQSNGAVKNLVMSYEEIPFKEENEAKHKVQILREQRNKEMMNVVEQSRMILHTLATLNEFGDAAAASTTKSTSEQQQHHLEGYDHQNYTTPNTPSPQQLQQQQRGGSAMKSSNSEAEIQSTTPCVVNQQTERHDLQNLLQKELSTISERTEHSSSANCLATIAGSTVNTSFTVPSPQITNANSNSRLTSLVTKSVRHQNPNFLDMTSTTIAGSGGNISATCGSSEYLVGNTTTVSSASTALKQGMSRAHSSYTPPKPARNPNDYDNAGNNTGGEGANAAAGRYIKNATRKSFKNSKSNDGGGGSDSNGERGGGGGLKAVYDYNNSILKEHFRNIDMKPDQGNQVNAQNTTTFVDRAGDTYGRNSNNVGHHDDDDDDRNEEEDEVDEVSDDSDCESEVDQNEEEEEYQPKLTRTPYSPSSIIMDSHQPDFAPPMEHNFNPNHCNDCMQKFLEQQLIAKDYEHQQQQQQQMSHEYSSQEDILSSLRGCVESPSMELSEAIYLNEFEMSKREDEPLSAAASNANARFSRGGAAVSEASRPSVISQSTENLRKSFYSSFDRRTSSKKKASDSTEHLLSSHSNSHYMNLTSSAKAPGAAETVRSSKSHSSLAASSTKPSPTSKKTPVDDRSSPSTNSIMATTPATAKLGNVRLDKHIIDMSKYKDYIYKLETRSDVSNQYFIKSLLTNEQTGHSLVLSQTKVKTPKMLTKLIIDQ